MRVINVILVCLSTVIFASFLGCAILGGERKFSGTNWALAENGGRVYAFDEDPGHPASTLINGITSSQGWDQGEGWQASIVLAPREVFNDTQGRMLLRPDPDHNWVVVEFAQAVTVHGVSIYTIDSEKYPARDFGVSDLLVQYEVESLDKAMFWVDVERYGKRLGQHDSRVRNNVEGVINVRFKPVNTHRICILIHRTNDLEGTIRLTEIEVY